MTTTMAAFDMGVLKFMPAYECLKAIHRDRLLRETEGNDDARDDAIDGEEGPIRASDRALVPATSSSSSCVSSSMENKSPSPSPSSSSSPPSSCSEEGESYTCCSEKVLDDDKINTWISSKVFFMPAAATDRPFDKSSSRRLRRNRDEIFGRGSPDVATVLKLGRETMRAPFASSATAIDISAAAGNTAVARGNIAAAAAAAATGERKKNKTAGTGQGSRGGRIQASAMLFTDDAANNQDKRGHAVEVAAAAVDALPSLSFSGTTPRSEFFWGVGDW